MIDEHAGHIVNVSTDHIYPTPGLRDRIRFMELSTPTDLERNVGLYRGAVYGLESSLMMTAIFRPRMRSSILNGLDLAGSSVHLGGGIPVCLGSGMIAADRVSEDL